MYTPIQLEAIKIFGRKDLTEGCLLQNKKSLIIYKHSWVNLNNKNIYYFDWYEHSYFYQDDLIFFEILWHIPHFERIIEVLYEKDIAVTLWHMHKKSIVLDFLNEKDDECRIREIDYDWTKEPLEQDEKVLKELIEIVENAK